MREPTLRQLRALGFVILLSPATRLLPGAAARLGSHSGWLGPIIAAPFCVLTALAVSHAMEARRPGEGLGELIARKMPRFGRGILAVYGLWLALYAGFSVRSAASRFIYTIYTGASPWVFVAFGLAVIIPAALSSARRLTRTATIFRALLIAALAPIIILGVAQIDVSELLPIRAADLPGLLTFSAEVLGTVAFALVNVTFLETGNIEPGRGCAFSSWSVRVCLFFAVMIAAVLGRFGPDLAGDMTYPFFALVRNTGLGGVSVRIEALVTGLWVLSDFVLGAFALMAAGRCFALAANKTTPRARRVSTLIAAAAALGCALVAAPNLLVLRFLSQKLVVWANLAAVFVIMLPTLVVIIIKSRKK